MLDAATLRPRSTVQLRTEDRPTDLSFSPDGRLLLVGGEGGDLHVIDTASGHAREPASASNGAVQQIEWLPDGRTAVVSGDRGLIAFFDAVRGLVRTAPLPASTDGGQAAYFMAPGPTDEVAVLGDRDWVISYPVTPSAWFRAVCTIAGRDLTRAEWERYLPGREYRPTCTDLG
jgi:WD40 repeat protein